MQVPIATSTALHALCCDPDPRSMACSARVLNHHLFRRKRAYHRLIERDNRPLLAKSVRRSDLDRSRLDYLTIDSNGNRIRPQWPGFVPVAADVKRKPSPWDVVWQDELGRKTIERCPIVRPRPFDNDSLVEPVDRDASVHAGNVGGERLHRLRRGLGRGIDS